VSSKKRVAIIISASSDIGAAVAERWLEAGWAVYGTYRTRTAATDRLETLGMTAIACDLASAESVQVASAALTGAGTVWDVLIVCSGTQVPVGPFVANDFVEWERSIRVNFTGEMQVVHALMPSRRIAAPHGPCVLLFAGGGTNDAPPNYSAYIVSKIALMKMCELLDAEVADTRFVILGPGWVRTKIHNETLAAGTRAGSNFERTQTKLASDELTPMEQVVDCCDWIVASPREIVGGRNFSVVFDRWGTPELEAALASDRDMYKLRRNGNDSPAK
jgi:NAD(P)-dependent dehydrogenase (short-subunit alcohol dehydrogenase family)